MASVFTRAAGLVREQVSAAVFGVGSVYGAFQYAGLIPSLFLVILGGLNGPLHSAMVTVLAGRSPEHTRPIVDTLSVVMGVILAGTSAILFLFAPQWIDLIAPGLAVNSEVRSLAILQLRIMAPLVWFGGMKGLSIGILNSRGNFWLPTASPLLSSLTVIVGLMVWMRHHEPEATSISFAQTGAIVLAGTFLLGGALQWLVQWLAQRPFRLLPSKIQWAWQHPDTRAAFRIIGAALLVTGMVQANWYIDLAFTSWLPNPGIAVSALTFANLLAQAPLGIITNMLLVPMLPLLAKSSSIHSFSTNPLSELQEALEKSFRLFVRLTLPISMLMAALATPAVAVVYQRGAFDRTDTSLVGTVLFVYGIGISFTLSRDFLIRVFHVLDANRLLLWLSFGGLGLNVVFNLLLYQPLGVAGLALGSGLVNVILTIWMMIWLNRRLYELMPHRELTTFLKLLAGHAIAGVLTWEFHSLLPKTHTLPGQATELAIAALFGIGLSVLVQRLVDFSRFLKL